MDKRKGIRMDTQLTKLLEDIKNASTTNSFRTFIPSELQLLHKHLNKNSISMKMNIEVVCEDIIVEKLTEVIKILAPYNISDKDQKELTDVVLGLVTIK